ncbi:vascular cell adhesion protein 1-like [Halichoeres trimaculatus]|uniref:vascular cell adhesion protein 1-like n=1 Tax=Halichoeres trimaculatus TaxID=147232 RepID=UPI003D9F2DB4
MVHMVMDLLSAMMTTNFLLSVFFLRGALAQCPDIANLFFKTPEKMEALSGSCLQIPCTFSTKAYHNFGQEEVFGMWIKNHRYFGPGPENVIYNSSRTINPYPMNITGNLRQKECTTLFSNINLTHEGIYYFRIESTSFQATAICNSLQITVRDSPPSPRLEISGDLKEGDSVTVTCSALTPCPRWPPKLTLNLQKDSHNLMEENTDGSFTTKIQESITLSEQHDGYNISCSAAYPVNEGEEEKTAEETKTLIVSYPPRDTSVLISPADPVSVGSMVNLTCSCRRSPPVVHFVWFMISDGRLELIKVDTQVYVLKVTSSDRDRLFFCGCRNDLDIQLSKGLQLTFKGDQLSVGGEVVLKILGIMLLVGALIIFECWIRSRGSMKPEKAVERPQTFRQQDKVEADYVNTVAELVSSREDVDQSNMMIPSLFLGVLFVSGACTPCSKQPDLEIVAPKTLQAPSGSCLQIPCNFRAKSDKEFDGRGRITGVWIRRDSRYAIDPSNVVFNSSRSYNSYPMEITGNLNQKNCTTLFSNVITSYSDTYFFRVESNPFSATASCDSVKVIVKDSPPSPSIEISGDLKEGDSVTVTCSALTPCPRWPPKLTWNLQKASHNHMEQNTDGSFTTKIQESITLSEQHDGYNISCSASYPVNEGEEEKTAEETKTLSVLYAPKDTSVSISPSGLVSAGTKVNLTCSCSRAKPPVSSFTWFKISNNRPPVIEFIGEFYSVNVTTDGVYYCEAANNVGKQKSPEIHLNIKGAQLWGAGVGGMIGVVVLLSGVAVVIWWLKSKHSQQTQSPGVEEPAVRVHPRASDKEDIHYGEIDFSKLKTGPSPKSVQDRGLQQDTLYAQVKVSKPGLSFSQAPAGTEELYAQVKTH